MIKHGTCSSVGLFPITDETVCEAAARDLGLPDTNAAATTTVNRPEGCYYYNNEGQRNFDIRTDGLWMSLNVSSKLKGAETSNLANKEYRFPICTSQAQCGLMEDGIAYKGNSYYSLENVPSATVCCQKCQADLMCGAWTWEKDGGRACSLQIPQQDHSAPRSRKMDGMVSGLPIRLIQLRSLFCLALMRPEGNEQALLQMQFKEHVSIFACDEFGLFSNKEVEIAPSIWTAVIGSDLRCKYGGDSGTALNTGIFIALWKKVISDGRFRFHDWTVKVDPDAVFFPDRLRGLLVNHHEGERGVYVNNCKYGLHGPIEVFSRRALESYATYYLECEKKLWFAFTHWGEDMYMDQCLQQVVNITRDDDWALICEDHCDCPEYLKCNTGAATFHPFKEIDSYRQCMLSAGAVLAP